MTSGKRRRRHATLIEFFGRIDTELRRVAGCLYKYKTASEMHVAPRIFSVGLVFSVKKIELHFYFCWKMHQKWLKQILRLVPFQNQINFLYNTGLLFPMIWDPRAIFKAVPMAVDKTLALQTKCKTCFGGPRMILHAH